MNRFLMGVALAAAIFAFAGMKTATAAGHEATVSATSPWVSQGRYFLTGEKEALFIGVMGGILYVEDAQGRLDAIEIICPGDFVINLETGAQEGEGKCVLQDLEGHNVFANWTCVGESFTGCKGDFTLTAGTDKFQGITGGGPLEARTAFSGIAVDLQSGAVVEASAGLLKLPKLSYKLP